MKVLYKILSISLISNISFAANLPESLSIPDNIKKEIVQVSALKIGKKHKEFVYNKEFADLLQIDKSKAIKMPKDMYAAGITFEEESSETDKKYVEYKVKFHIFVKHNDDYALPDDSWGDWYASMKMQRDMRDLVGKTEVYPDNDFRMKYSMNSFISNDYLEVDENIDDNYYIRAGSAIYDKYQKNVYKNIDYISYYIFSGSIPKANKNISIWIKKRKGPDFKYSSSGPKIAKDFYHFSLPNQLKKNSCKYMQKVYLEYNWNEILGNFNTNFQGSISLESKKNYICI